MKHIVNFKHPWSRVRLTCFVELGPWASWDIRGVYHISLFYAKCRDQFRRCFNFSQWHRVRVKGRIQLCPADVEGQSELLRAILGASDSLQNGLLQCFQVVLHWSSTFETENACSAHRVLKICIFVLKCIWARVPSCPNILHKPQEPQKLTLRKQKPENVTKSAV